MRRFVRWTVPCALLGIVFLFVFNLPPDSLDLLAFPERMQARDIRVVDGDTIHLHGTRIRLLGIDAPESGQICHDKTARPFDCGAAATAALGALVAGEEISCRLYGHDRWHRRLGVCRTSGSEINRFMVATGMAYARSELPVLQIAETIAWLGGRGFWEGSFTSPQLWRRSH